MQHLGGGKKVCRKSPKKKKNSGWPFEGMTGVPSSTKVSDSKDSRPLDEGHKKTRRFYRGGPSTGSKKNPRGKRGKRRITFLGGERKRKIKSRSVFTAYLAEIYGCKRGPMAFGESKSYSPPIKGPKSCKGPGRFRNNPKEC